MSLVTIEWILLGLLAAAALAAATIIGRFSMTLARRRGRRIEARLICPRTGGLVDCELVHDDRTGACLGVTSCSRFGPGAAPTCEQDCVKLINLGIPLHPPGADHR